MTFSSLALKAMLPGSAKLRELAAQSSTSHATKRAKKPARTTGGPQAGAATLVVLEKLLQRICGTTAVILACRPAWAVRTHCILERGAVCLRCTGACMLQCNDADAAMQSLPSLRPIEGAMKRLHLDQSAACSPRYRSLPARVQIWQWQQSHVQAM